MRQKSLRRWNWVHEWSSLICTPFLLLLCITGLPLIFHHEIHDFTVELVQPASPAPEQPASLDTVVANGLAAAPGQVVQYVSWDEEQPDVVMLTVNSAVNGNPGDASVLRMDAGTGVFLDRPDLQTGVMAFLLQLHTDMFLGLPGKLFLGAMGILFCIAVISGIVVYGPSMRKLSFGDLRLERIRLIRWLDLHNLAGTLLIAWTLVVGFTGAVNTWADLVLQVWRFDQLTEMVGEHRGRPHPETLSSLQQAVTTAEANVSGMEPSVIAFPGTPFSSESHYMVFMKGKTPLTARLVKPVLIDATNSAFTDARQAPWYVSALLLSQPLHFGDYGGLALKILWALLDIGTIVVLITGLYLWVARRARKLARLSPLDKRDAEPVVGSKA
ncbi:PepSY-associated TM helix domain-containing protein [Methyloligella sp. 2.7D]|uniref:PepSY-associated TM helix domain-containing protein n=1 Tax=unclassified Methyloligella TaxID=2625955 RepID=UPI00157D2E23|nr:PepSY-associated TM helix domain-containing protein [Methyloligella sp. GL2]QKP78029.1 PepSY domain-containing protein [Methyloligella sp. GL2]